MYQRDVSICNSRAEHIKFVISLITLFSSARVWLFGYFHSSFFVLVMGLCCGEGHPNSGKAERVI